MVFFTLLDSGIMLSVLDLILKAHVRTHGYAQGNTKVSEYLAQIVYMLHAPSGTLIQPSKQ